MRNYYAEFLELKSKIMLDRAVSKVSKGQKGDEKQTFDTFDTALSDEFQKNNIPHSNHQILKKMKE